MAVWITGDTHGDWMSRLSPEYFPSGAEANKKDFVIVLGDFGIWDGSRREKHNLDWLEKQPFTTLFIDGNHENYDILDSLPISEWHGGRVQFVRPSVIHLMRGEIFNIDGCSFFTFGGARSHDIRDGVFEKDDPRVEDWKNDLTKLYRINHVSWWEREMPSRAEMEHGYQILNVNGRDVDYILTHTACNSFIAQVAGECDSDAFTEFLQWIKQNVDYRRWYFGHFHVNRMLQWDKAMCLYEQINRIL